MREILSYQWIYRSDNSVIVSELAKILAETGPPAPVVLGVGLVPYTVGHAILLQRLRSPYVLGGEITSSDLAEAVLVCSQSPLESIKSIKSIWRDLALWIWGKRIQRMNLMVESDKFQLWLKEQSTAPEVLMEAGSKSKRPAMPWPEQVLVGCLNIGIGPDDAIKMPIGDAERLILAHAEMMGQVQLWDDQSEAIWQSQNAN